MKLRSLLIALSLGFILYLAPVIADYLPNLPVWPGLSRLFEKQAAHNLQTQSKTAQPTTYPNPDPPLSLDASAQREMARLFIAKWSSPAVVKAGELLTYTIVVTNTGAATARAIVIYDELPAGVHFHGESNLTVIKGENPQLQVTARQITGTVSTLQATGRIVFTGRAIVDPTASGTLLYNTAQVTATNNSNSNNRATAETGLLTTIPTSTATIVVIQSATPVATVITLATVATPTPTGVPDLADLQIRKTAAPDPVSAGAIVTYTIVVSNLGPGRAHKLVIRDILPPSLFFDGNATLTVLRGEQPQLLLSRSQLTGTIAMLNVGGLLTITTPVRAPSVTVKQFLINQASVTATTLDQQPANNSAGAPVAILPAPKLEHKTFLPAITH